MDLLVNEAKTGWDQELSLPGAPAVCVAYENAPGSSLLHRFLVDIYSCNNRLAIPKHAVPGEFVMEIAFSLKERIVRTGDAGLFKGYDRRRYHQELPNYHFCA